MRLRSGIRCDAVFAVILALAALLALASTSRAAPPTEAPADLQVIYSDARLIGVAWSPVADPLVGTQVTWGPTGSSDPPGVATAGQAHEWWLDVRCGQELSISVALRNADGAGPPATVTAASDPCDPGPPEPPVVGVAVHGGSVELSWQDAVANDVTQADITLTRPGEFTSSTQVNWPYTTGRMAGLRCGTAYDLSVTFVDYDGNRSAAATTPVTTVACDKLGPAPDAPGNLHVVGAVGSTVTLAWDLSPLPGVVATNVTVEGGGWLTNGASDLHEVTMPLLPGGCGDRLATVTLLYQDGRISKPATLTLPGRRCPPPPPKTLGPVPYHRAGITVHRQARVTVRRNGGFVLPRDTVQCPEVGGNCRVTVRVETRIPGKRGLGPPLLLGAGETTLTPRLVQTVTGRLSPRGRALLLRRGRLRVTITIEAWHVAGLYAVAKHTTFVPARR